MSEDPSPRSDRYLHNARYRATIDTLVNLVIAAIAGGLVALFGGPTWGCVATGLIVYMICTRQHG